MNRLGLLCAVLLAAAAAARADEGMWTYDNFPAAKVGKKYGFTPDQKGLDEARLSSVRLAGGCSGSFVSPDGLVMTNHHCAIGCVGQLSTKDKDFVEQGFYAPEQAQEVHAFIRGRLTEAFGQATANRVVVQYGGSVKADNAGELLSRPDIDGALVGGASLKAADFLGIIQAGVAVSAAKKTG